MIIYDSTSISFMRKSEDFLRQILQEIGITVRRSRFVYKNYLYPVQVVVFEGPEWGHFNAPYFQIGLNRRLIYQAKDAVVKDILRHELAHYLTYIEYGPVEFPHGPEFKSICERFGFDKNISLASMNLALENEEKVGDLASERVLEKVKKLLQLAQSSNAHEAELATVKANELLLRHNLEHVKDKEEPIYLERLLMQKRKDAKLSAIYEILRHFIVRPVISHGKNHCCLEVSGAYANVKLAQYVAEFLNRELDHLWESARQEHSLRGLRSKNSFFAGVARGFDEKMKGLKQGFKPQDQKALMVVEQKLAHDVQVIYKRLSHSYSGAVTDAHAKSVGVEKGRNLSIRQGVEGKAKGLYLPG